MTGFFQHDDHRPGFFMLDDGGDFLGKVVNGEIFHGTDAFADAARFRA